VLDAAIRNVVEGEPDVVSAWFFGSRARDEGRSDSDIDVALLLRGDVADRAERVHSIGMKLKSALQVRVDVVDVAHATPTLGWEIVTGGRRVFARDVELADATEERWLQVWLDTAHMRRVQHHYLYGDPL